MSFQVTICHVSMWVRLSNHTQPSCTIRFDELCVIAAGSHASLPLHLQLQVVLSGFSLFSEIARGGESYILQSDYEILRTFAFQTNVCMFLLFKCVSAHVCMFWESLGVGQIVGYTFVLHPVSISCALVGTIVCIKHG